MISDYHACCNLFWGGGEEGGGRGEESMRKKHSYDLNSIILHSEHTKLLDITKSSARLPYWKSLLQVCFAVK